MKIFSLLFLATVVASKFLPADNLNASNNNEKEQVRVGCGTTIGVDTMPPAKIQSSFTAKYPNASNVKWYRYTPTTKVEPGYWYSNLDANDYYVSFVMNDDDYIAWYDNENWIYSTHRIDNTELPAAVNQAIGAEYPGFIVTDVDMEHDSKQQLYEVKLQKGNERWNVHYTPTGTVFKKKQKNLTPATAESAMVTDFESRYPGASEVVWYRYDPIDRVEILPSDWNYSMDANDYQVVFNADGNQYVAYYDNGSWIYSETYKFDRTKLPAAVNSAINSEYAGYTIKDVSREDNRSRVVYEVELMKGNDKCKIHYGADGSVVKKKCRTDGVKTKS